MGGDALVPTARCGAGTLDGACWRPGDALKHLGPPQRLHIGYRSQLFSTRCGLGPEDGDWRSLRHDGSAEDDDCWCPPCLIQAGIAYELYEDGE